MNKSEHNEEKINYIIKMLSEMDVDGETMEHIITEVGMEEQILRQLVMKVGNEQLLDVLIERKNLNK